MNETNFVDYHVFNTVNPSWTTLVSKPQLLDLRFIEANKSFSNRYYCQLLPKLNRQLLRCQRGPLHFR
jgi:hypothetical protein